MSPGNYGFSAQLLHRLALGTSSIAEASFDCERMLHAKKCRDVSQQRHVFVSGLARAGTTILMRELYGTGLFRSLTYRDMPFVLAPNLWQSLNRHSRRHQEDAERAHGDGIRVGFDSPEAFDEVFWKTFCRDEYLRRDHLAPMQANRETLEKFRAYVALVMLEHPEQRYLSKNNNNVLRLDSIAKAFPNAVILVPFREPLQQANSLLRQHLRFLEEHQRSKFSRNYMTWLAHHEFGADHRPFRFGEDAPPPQLPSDDLNYWVELWVNTYSFVLQQLPEQCMLVSYDQLCQQPRLQWSRILQRCDLPPDAVEHGFRRSWREIKSDVAPALAERANTLFERLVDRSQQINVQAHSA